MACVEPELYRMLDEYSDTDSELEQRHGLLNGRIMGPEYDRRARRKELQKLYAACYLGASEVTTRHFGGSTFATLALGLLLEVLEEHLTHGHEF